MVKIREDKQPNRTGMAYVKAVEESRGHLRDFHARMGRAVKESELAQECRNGLGPTWTYDAELDCCVDERLADFNKTLRREGNEITVNVHSLTDDNFRGSWGTPVTSDDTIHSFAGWSDSDGNATLVLGEDPTKGWPGKSGYSYALKREEKKKLNIRL